MTDQMLRDEPDSAPPAPAERWDDATRDMARLRDEVSQREFRAGVAAGLAAACARLSEVVACRVTAQVCSGPAAARECLAAVKAEAEAIGHGRAMARARTVDGALHAAALEAFGKASDERRAGNAAHARRHDAMAEAYIRAAAIARSAAAQAGEVE